MKKILFLSVLLWGLATSCDPPGTDILYTDEFLELDAATTVTGSKSFTYLRVDDGQPIPSGFVVNLGAAHQSSAINFTFEVDAANSTAIENLHYMISGNSATIEPNSSTAELPIMILDDNIEAGEILTIVVNLTGGDIPVNPNYETATHEIQVSCPVESSRFVGDYVISYDENNVFPFGAATFGPEGTVVTLSDASTGSTFKRNFEFVYLEAGAYGNGPEVFTMTLTCGSVAPDGETGALGGGLSCDGATSITIAPAAEAGSYNPNDDSSFTMVYAEFVQDGGCGISPPIVQKVTFTKQ